MDDLSNKTALVYDYGYNLPLARRLAREFGKVRYFCPWKDSEPESRKLAIGSGFQDIERVRDFFDPEIIGGTDLFVFPEIYDGDLQLHLEGLHKRVWGSRMAERLEYARPLFYQTVKDCGLDAVEFEVITGMTDLEDYLAEHEKRWVKVNLRGDDETWFHQNMRLSARKLEALRHKHGAIAGRIVFTVCANIDSVLEAAYDGFMVTGSDGREQFPELGFLGYENKNLSHILTATPYADFPDKVREVNDRFAPHLARHKFRSAWGTEVKLTEDGRARFLDATCRQPSPPGEIIMEMAANLGSFFYHGAGGDLTPLEVAKNDEGKEQIVGVQVVLYSEWSKTNWQEVQIEPGMERWIKLSRCCGTMDGACSIIPDKSITTAPEGIERIGSVVALGTSIEEACARAKEYCEAVEAMYLTNEYESLAECVRRIQAGEDEGVEFAGQEVPSPAVVVEGED